MYPLFLLVDFQKSSINQACLPCFFTSTKRLLFDLKRLLDKDAICEGLRFFGGKNVLFTDISNSFVYESLNWGFEVDKI